MNNSYTISQWSDYAMAHSTVTCAIQVEVNAAAAAILSGRVIDFGCGTAKILPFLVDSPKVLSYTGIDLSESMLDQAHELAQKLSYDRLILLNDSIANTPDQQFDSGVSIHSYYSWPDPILLLSKIFDVLSPGAPFVLVTPNNHLNMAKLISEADKSLLMHPNYHKFKTQNLQFVGNEAALFVDMDTLCTKVKSVGFQIVECHQRFYAGGANFLHLIKPKS